MDPIIIIGGTGFDVVHLVLFLLALALAGTAWWLAGKSGAKAERLSLDLERATDELVEAKQRVRTLEEVSRKAELELAEARARSAEDERKFGEMAQGVLQRANAQFLQLANETFEKHVALANFKENHTAAENRRQYKLALRSIDGALNQRLTPELRLHAKTQRAKLRSLID